jgi:two-component system NtrC family sensor kinase
VDETYRWAWLAAPLAILTLDAQMRVCGSNPACERMLGRSRDELRGMPLPSLSHAFDRGALVQMLTEAYGGRVPPRQELRFMRPDGSEIVTGCNLASAPDGDGGLVCLLRDLSREKVFRPQILHTERMASIGTVASVVVHELNNAFAGALGCLQLMPRALEPGAQELLDTVMSELERATEIVRELKRYARVEDGSTDAIRFDELAARLLRLHRYQHPGSGEALHVRVHVERGLPELRGNGNQLLQALLNLVRNAEQAVAHLPAERRIIDVRGRAVGETLVVEVADRGPGVPAHLRGRVFEPFYSTKPAGDGTGLGLTVVQAVTAGHGGRVEVDETPGGGATFRMVLPVAPPSVSPVSPVSRPRAHDERPRLQGARVLVADDEPVIRHVIERACSRHGAIATSVDGAEAAKQALRACDFDVVLIDVRMPGGGAAEVLRAMRADRPWLVSRTVLMSGELSAEASVIAGEGDARILSKPFGLQELLDALEQAIGHAPRIADAAAFASVH